MKVEVSGYTVVSKADIKCLRVIIDTKLSFMEHRDPACHRGTCKNVVFSAFRAISDDSVLVLTGMILINILAKEMSALNHAKCMEGHIEHRNGERSKSKDL